MATVPQFTPKDIDALPNGPWRQCSRTGKMKLGREVIRAYDLDDPIAFCDTRGMLWTVGQLADGNWFKRPM